MEQIKISEYVNIKVKGSNLPTIISFSQVNTPMGKFKPYRTIENVNANIIFVNDHGNHWYQSGIRGISENTNTAALELVKIAREIGSGRVITFGTSMGAFGAMLFATLGSADGCLAFGVESILKMEGSRSKQYISSTTDIMYPDLLYILKDNIIPMVLFVSENDEVDLINAVRLKDIPKLDIVTIKGTMHPGEQFFDMKKRIGELISEYAFTGEFPSGCKREGEILKDEELVKKLYENFLIKTVEKDYHKMNDFMINMKIHWPEDAFVMLRYGEAKYRTRDLKEAEKAWRKSIVLDPYQFEAYSKLGALLRKRGEISEAIELLQKSIEINPYEAHAYHTIGLSYTDLKDLPKAEIYFRKAFSLNHGNKAFKKSLANCLLKTANSHIEEAKKLLESF